MQLYFIRHGQSGNNLLWAQTGSSQGRSEDPALTPTGQQQAQHVARFLNQNSTIANSAPGAWATQNVNGFGITHLYCSLMIRAVATGTAIATEIGLPLIAWKDLHETGGIHCINQETGEYIGLPGKNRAYFRNNFPNLVLPDDLGAEGWWNRPFEKREERAPRAQRVLRELLERHGGTDDRVAMVSHGGFHIWFLASILNLSNRNGYWFTLNNTAMTRIDFENDSRVNLVYMNRADYLPRELIT